jgi:transposase, IS5 family
VRKGTSPQSLTAIASLIDATVIGSASKGDKDAAWVGTRAPAHGCKAHLAAAKDNGIIRGVETTPVEKARGSKRTIVCCGPFVPRSQGARQIPSLSLREGICLETPRSLARIEKIFGTWKRSYRFRCMRRIGLSKARLQVHLAVIAYNVKRYWRMQTA